MSSSIVGNENGVPHKNPSEMTVSSGLLMESRRFVWRIENFGLLRKSKNLIYAQKFEFAMGQGIGLPTTWSFQLSPTRSEPVQDSSSRWIGCYFELLKFPQGVVDVNADIRVLIRNVNGDQNGWAFFEGGAEFENFIDTNGMPTTWGYSQMIEQGSPIETLPLEGGALTIEAEVKLFAPKSYVFRETVKSTQDSYKVRFLQQLSKDLKKMRTLDLPSSDFATKIISEDNVEFPVHRGILSARSGVFQRMFQTTMTESETGIVRLDDLSSKVVDVILQYITTGTLHKTWRNHDVIEKLIYASDKYELNLLLEFLNDVLGTVCTKDNAKRLALLAQQIGLEKAKADLFQFIKNNATSLEDLTVI